MKLHWGHGIALFYLFFVGVLALAVVQSTRFDNSLVTEDYYLRDIHYQQEYERRSNSRQRGTPLEVQRDGQAVRLRFPAGTGPASGTVLLYRPSTARHDRRVRVHLDPGGSMALPTGGLPRGRYVAIVEWSADGTDYYDELNLDL
ncbi:FixH family protein [Lewinella sp. IMCC34183]|uniref:FixH family protein n=1 Tax=Lewinella sp. IMCC34183 TaxID=2248762 RepID=UPI000E2305B7|nr:FixH family protein [Lewinella sp. IMCC34183]